MAAVIEVGEAFTIRPACPPTEYDEFFLRGMVNRMGVSFYKYGSLAEAYPLKVNALESLKQRLAAYEETGNTEHLIDLANYAQIEFMHPSHPEAHFDAQDSDGSPGRVSKDGAVSYSRNEEL